MIVARPTVAPAHEWLDAEDAARIPEYLDFAERVGQDHPAVLAAVESCRRALQGEGALRERMHDVERTLKAAGLGRFILDARYGLSSRTISVFHNFWRSRLRYREELEADALSEWLAECQFVRQMATEDSARSLSMLRAYRRVSRQRRLRQVQRAALQLHRRRPPRASRPPGRTVAVRPQAPRAPSAPVTSALNPERDRPILRAPGGVVAT